MARSSDFETYAWWIGGAIVAYYLWQHFSTSTAPGAGSTAPATAASATPVHPAAATAPAQMQGFFG